MSLGFVEAIQRIVRSPAFKFVVVLFLILVLTIPLFFVWLLSSERQDYAYQAQSSVSADWGGQQNIQGPFIIVPTLQKNEIKTEKETRVEVIRKYAVFMPEVLNVKSEIKTEVRKRGIFPVPVYNGKLTISGHFIKPDLARFERSVDEIVWSEAVLAFLVSDVKGIKENIELNINAGATKQLFRSGVGVSAGNLAGVHAPLSEDLAKSSFDFNFGLVLNGSSHIKFAPVGGETTVSMKADWANPAFNGFLPEQGSKKITDNGFEAQWKIPRLARNIDQAFITDQFSTVMDASLFGVDFYQPVGYYGLVERSLKYAIAFVSIIFFAVFIMEVQSGKRVHWIQYVFVGLALLLFYLVLLGTSEHFGFELSYIFAALATSALISIYVASALKSVRHGGGMFATCGLIYGLLYLLLRAEDYAMLIGSLGAFILLATVMMATRNVDWSNAGQRAEN